jgi:alkanesulfonate monooxygenase SsuD/methylene tetrahydromethanopterin reductase-like flavin-dependent oxidoreductase (luciferase family)
MQVGILYTSHPELESDPHPHHGIHQRTTDEILEAEQLGFDGIWIAEHHFSNRYGIMPDPFSYLGYLAAKTSVIKLGAAVMIVPLHHPLRIVENAAFIDILSNGRFQLGMGSGYRPYEFDGLGVPYDERRAIQAEAIPLILDGFHKKQVKADGKYFNFDVTGEWEIYPQPVQQPHPPFYMGAGTNESIAMAARNGFGLMQSTLPSAQVIGEHIAHYRAHMAEAPAPYNQNPAFGDVDVCRMTFVAPTDAKAKELSEAGITRHMKSFMAGGAKTGGYLGDISDKSGDEQFSYDNLMDGTILHGSPDTVLRKIEEFKAVGTTSLMLHYPPYYGQQQTLEMLRLFSKEVLPHVQAMDAPRLMAAE